MSIRSIRAATCGVRTVHHWFDYWLQGVPNGIMSEPPVMVETAPGTMTDTGGFPIPGSTPTQVFLKPARTPARSGSLPGGRRADDDLQPTSRA